MDDLGDWRRRWAYVPRRFTSCTSRAGAAKCTGFTVPAINVRGMAYDTARAIFRTAVRMHAGAFILEIARSEIAYTGQRPAEYVTVMLAAALREGFRGPVFIQGDHFQVNAKKYAADPAGEVAAVKQLALEAVSAGFYNIDVDTSTLVDISLADARRAAAAQLRDGGRDHGVRARDSSRRASRSRVGGEIGEVGTKNSTVEELRAFMDGYNAHARAARAGRGGALEDLGADGHVARRRGAAGRHRSPR